MIGGMDISILPVQAVEKKAFIEVPWRIYEGVPQWVPPLWREMAEKIDSERNPIFERLDAQFYIALVHGEPVGRISAHIDRLYNEFHDERTGFFGFFECIHSQLVAQRLLEKACGWLYERGMTRVLGPMSYNMNEECGLLVEGFDQQPTLMMPYNPPYYAEYIEKTGFEKAKDLLAYTIDLTQKDVQNEAVSLQQRAKKMSQRAIEKGYSARSVNLADFDAEVDRLRSIYEEAWGANWGFSPLTENEFRALARELKHVVEPQLGVMVEQEGEPVAFGLILPDFNQALKAANGRLFPFGLLRILWHQRRIDGLRFLLLGIKEKHRVRGVDALIYHWLIRHTLESNYRWVEASWVLEDNHRMRQTIERIGTATKRYRIYEKLL